MAWIYEIEAHPQFGPIVHPFLRDRLDAGKNRAGSSLLALGELLVQPLCAGRDDIAVRYRQFFVSGGGFQVWEVTRSVVERAASLRATYRVKMVDALHPASALENRADLFVSNDADLRQVRDLRVVILSDYMGTG